MEIEITAGEAARRFGPEARTLEPLYSLADFCYVVRREVIEAVGSADEGYKLGPCWEMDYNIRAARAGWRGVWAGAAYVHRQPFTARRKSEEARYFQGSKRHYQDKFCGSRLRGEKTDYRAHCRGDACPNFAPAQLIKIKQSVAAANPGPTETAGVPSGVAEFQSPDSQVHSLLESKTIETVPSPPARIEPEPLVSCIMPTYNRRAFVPQAIRCFLRQDYPNCELLVIDDGTEPVADCVPESENIRYVRLDQKMTIGAKRNLACEQARGEFIVHWDDDDWYPPWRVRMQVAASGIAAETCRHKSSSTTIPPVSRLGNIDTRAPAPRGSPATRSLIARVFGSVTSFPTFRWEKTRVSFGTARARSFAICVSQSFVWGWSTRGTPAGKKRAEFTGTLSRASHCVNCFGDDVYFTALQKQRALLRGRSFLHHADLQPARLRRRRSNIFGARTTPIEADYR